MDERVTRLLHAARVAASWIDRRAPMLLLLSAAALPLPVFLASLASSSLAITLFSIVPALAAWSALGYIRDARRGRDRTLTRFLHDHGRRAWIYSFAGLPVGAGIFAVLHGIDGTTDFGLLLGGLALTIQLWCIALEALLILTALLHATRHMQASLGSGGILLLSLGLIHVAVAAIVVLADPSAEDFLLYAAPAATILLFAGGLLLVLRQILSPLSRKTLPEVSPK